MKATQKKIKIALFFTIPLILVALAVCGLSAVQNNKNVLPADNQSKATNIESETSPRPAGNDDKSAPKNNRSDNTVAVTNQDAAAKKIWHLKFVPADVGDQDLDMIAVAGFTVIATEDGVNDISPEEMRQILDRVQAHNLKMIVDGGFSAGAWGYRDDGADPSDQKPVWQKEKMTKWLQTLKNHPAIYGWDISNEAGENLPNGDRFKISLTDLKEAKETVRAIDQNRPIVIRMHYWDEYDGDFGEKNPFAKDLADIVMLNLYSNYSADGTMPLLPEMIADSAQKLTDKILAVDPNIKIWLSLAAFADPPMFLKPTEKDLNRDLAVAVKIKKIDSLGFFGWGDREYPWSLPRDGENLSATITSFIKNNN